MANKVAISLMYNLIDDLLKKSRILTDQKRHDAMMNLIKQLESIAVQIKIQGKEEIWDLIEENIKEYPDEVGMVLIKLPLKFSSDKTKGDKIRIIDFTELFNK